jgi:glycosyltransferase involved in cell wall biosynthesis
LWSLIYQSGDPHLFEILVIDNASSDFHQLRSQIENSENFCQRIRLIQEPTLGLSHARNRAVAEAIGDYVLFIDDDAIANTQLVEHYLRCIDTHQPDVIGGNVIPFFLVPPPAELDTRYWSQWSLKYFGSQDRWLRSDEYFIGANIGASRQILKTHTFDPRLGRIGNKLFGGEEWHLGAPHFKKRFVANSYVFHKVPESRMRGEYLANRQLSMMQQCGVAISNCRVMSQFFKSICSEVILFVKRVKFLIAIKIFILRTRTNQ